MKKVENQNVIELMSPEILLEQIYETTDILTPSEFDGLLKEISEFIESKIPNKSIRKTKLYRDYLGNNIFKMGDEITDTNILYFLEKLEKNKIPFTLELNTMSFILNGIEYSVTKTKKESFISMLKKAIDEFITILIELENNANKV